MENKQKEEIKPLKILVMGVLAQLGEHPPYKRKAKVYAGSIPAYPTNKISE